MIKLDVSELKRDPEYFKPILKQTGETVITKKDLVVLFPQKFVDKGLSELGTTCYVMGIMALVDLEAKRYTVIKVPGRIQMQPAEIDTAVINDTEYVLLEFMEDTDIISNNNIVKEAGYMFDIFDLLLIKSKIPWYLNYKDVVEVFDKINKYTGSKAADNRAVIELLTSIVARIKKNKKIQYRNYVNEIGKENEKELEWVGLENIFYSFNSTVSKIAGSYMELGLVSAIINPEKEISDLEHVLRE